MDALTVKQLREFLKNNPTLDDDALVAVTWAGDDPRCATYVGIVDGKLLIDMHPECEVVVNVDWTRMQPSASRPPRV